MKKLSRLFIILGIGGYLISILIKIMHYPGFDYFRIGGIALIVIGLVLIIWKQKKRPTTMHHKT